MRPLHHVPFVRQLVRWASLFRPGAARPPTTKICDTRPICGPKGCAHLAHLTPPHTLNTPFRHTTSYQFPPLNRRTRRRNAGAARPAPPYRPRTGREGGRTRRHTPVRGAATGRRRPCGRRRGPARDNVAGGARLRPGRSRGAVHGGATAPPPGPSGGENLLDRPAAGPSAPFRTGGGGRLGPRGPRIPWQSPA